MTSAVRCRSLDGSLAGPLAGWLAASILAAGCSFSGAQGTAEDPLAADAAEADAPWPDVMPADAPGTGVDARPETPATSCSEFKEIEGGRYFVYTTAVKKSDALAKCASIPGAHLATFESTEEVTDVVAGYPIQAKVWTGVRQEPPLFGGVRSGWANQIGTTRTSLPSGFPWRAGEPNDRNNFEDSGENEADLGPDGKFDDAHHSRLNQVLCECPDDGPGGE